MKFLENEIVRNLLISVTLLIIVYLSGIFFYTHVEQWSTLDSAYFITVTVTTIGYGDVVPRTNEGKMFTMALVWIGISIAFFTIYSIAAAREHMIDKHLLSRLRMFRDLASTRGKPSWPQQPQQPNDRMKEAFIGRPPQTR